tara:strand:+ start:1243 stop:1596 length:354 start_codon:yes stop_codon:yes gene_type:complete
MDIINWLKRSSTPTWAWRIIHYRRGESYEPVFYRPENLERAIESLMRSWSPKQPVLNSMDINLTPQIKEQHQQKIIKMRIERELSKNPEGPITVDSESGYWKHSAELKKFDWEGSLK